MSQFMLDFVRRPQPSRSGSIALAAGLLLTASVATLLLPSWIELTEQQAQNESLEQAIERRTKRPNAAPNAQQTALSKELLKVRDELDAPWQTIFEGLSEASMSQVSVLSLDPSAGRGQFRLTGETGEVGFMFDYIERIGKTRGFAGAEVVSQMRSGTDARAPLRFQLDVYLRRS